MHPGCGNGVLDQGESCDDGDLTPLDGCDGSCVAEEHASTASGTRVVTAYVPPGDPIAVDLRSPSAAPLAVVETSTTAEPPGDTTLVSRQIHTTGPQVFAAHPYEIVFTLDGTLLPQPVDPASVEVYQNGNRVRRCASRRRIPCAGIRMPVAGGGIRVDVYTARLGVWTFGTPTAAAVQELPLSGTRLLLEDRPGRSARRRLTLRSDDRAQLAHAAPGDGERLMVEGGSLRVVGLAAQGFDITYELPAEGWRPIDVRDPDLGMRFRDARGPITEVLFRAGGFLQVTGRGSRLGHELGEEPELVQVALRLGAHRYCLEFGDVAQFRVGRRALYLSAVPPPDCGID